MSLLFVGQAPGRGGDPARPLGSASASGRRFLRLAGLTEEQLYDRARVVNLVDYWPGKKGKGDAVPMVVDLVVITAIAESDKTVFVGRAVCDRLLGSAVSRRMDFFRWYSAFGGLSLFAVMPHPSGVNYWWNDPENEGRARRFLRRTLRKA